MAFGFGKKKDDKGKGGDIKPDMFKTEVVYPPKQTEIPKKEPTQTAPSAIVANQTIDYIIRIDNAAAITAVNAEKDTNIYPDTLHFTELIDILRNSDYSRVAIKFLNCGYWHDMDIDHLNIIHPKCDIHTLQFFRDPQDLMGYKDTVDYHIIEKREPLVILNTKAALLYKQNGHALLKEDLPLSFINLLVHNSIKGKG